MHSGTIKHRIVVTGHDRAWFCRPRRRGIPRALAAVLPAQTASRLQQAEFAVVARMRCVPYKDRWTPEENSRRTQQWLARQDAFAVVEFGPHGLRTWNTFGVEVAVTPVASRLRLQYLGDVFDQLRAMARRDVNAASSRKAVILFLRHLDPHILSAARKARAGDVNMQILYDWALVDPERRSQALAAYPLLAREMIGSCSNWQGISIAATIARNGSLEDILLSVTCGSRAMLRLLNGLSPRSIDRNFYVNGCRRSFFEKLRDTPEHLWPRSPRAWSRWVAILKTCHHGKQLGETGLAWMIAMDTLAIPDAVERLSAILGIEVPGVGPSPWARWVVEVEAAVRSSNDAITAFVTNVMRPAAGASGGINERNSQCALNAAHTGSPIKQVLQAIIGKGGLPALLRFSKGFHARVGRMDRLPAATAARITDAMVLPHICVEPVHGDAGWTAYPLCTAGALRTEGMTMSNCIGSYVDRCAKGKVFAFHVTGIATMPDGSDVAATATLRPADGGKGGYVVDDIRVKNDYSSINGVISAGELRKVARDLADLVNNMRLGIAGGEDAQRAIADYEATQGRFANAAYARETAEANLPVWMPIMPKRLRAATVDELLVGPLAPAFAKLVTKSRMKQIARAVEAGERPITKRAA